MLARGELDIEADLVSDTAPLNGLVAALLAHGAGVRALRDATRGGVATILNEIATAADVGVLVSEDAIPVRDRGPRGGRAARHRPDVRGVRGPDGRGRRRPRRPTPRSRRCARTRSAPRPRSSATSCADPPGMVQLKTAFGGTRIVDLLVGDPLPRIC